MIQSISQTISADSFDMIKLNEISSKSLSFSNIKRIFLKDLKEMRHNRTLFLTILFFPLLIAIGMPLLLSINFAAEKISIENFNLIAQDLNLSLKFQFLLIPIMMCAMIAGDSFAGEKERKTAESLMSLPLTGSEIFIGKIFIAFFPAMFYSLICFTLMGLELNIFFWKYITGWETLIIFGDPSFWVLAFITAPLYVLVMVQITVLISMRVSNAKAAQQLSMIFIAPALGLFFCGIEGEDMLTNPVFFLKISAIVLGIALLITIIAGKLFNKERFIMTL